MQEIAIGDEDGEEYKSSNNLPASPASKAPKIALERDLSQLAPTPLNLGQVGDSIEEEEMGTTPSPVSAGPILGA